MKTNEVRNKFIDYFIKNKHKLIPSSPLVPPNDPTLLFTNAGMVQFKQYFLGHAKPTFLRAVSSQCCIRAGGKHNDLDQVGYTARHHTFFEMMGNFSFGDYFKKEAIQFAWDFLVKELKLPKEKLWITVYKDDQEAADIWLKDIGISAKRLSYCGDEDNFWSMGPTGPCGPCSEIFYDHGSKIPGNPPGIGPEDGDRYVEIWNLVFMQYERLETGELVPLPMQSVDTGMGLERLSAVLQGVHNNYDIDIFQEIISAINALLPSKALDFVSLKVIADHIRSTSFLIAEGVLPSNEGRGYVLRRIIRRAVRYGYKLGLHDAFFYKLVAPLVKEMGKAYPVLVEQQSFIEKMIKNEELHFHNTLTTGLKIFESDLKQLKGNMIPGTIVFKMHDTYGFPLDLVTDVAKERKLKVDLTEYYVLMEKQKELAKSAHKFTTDAKTIKGHLEPTVFTGYKQLESKSKILNILSGDAEVKNISKNAKAGIILDQTPFYAEGGGQVGDVGKLYNETFEFIVDDTISIGNTFIHHGKVTKGSLSVGDSIKATVEREKRKAITRNHTATHLLHVALRNVLGSHVKQQGSLVSPDKLRFDFLHYDNLIPKQIKDIELWINEKIRENLPVTTEIMDIDEAKNKGAIALFQEKYEENVRVVSIDDISKELCGGTHAKSTGDLGLFKIVEETSIAAGIRRIEAITGHKALQWVYSLEDTIKELSTKLNVPSNELPKKVDRLLQSSKEMQENLEKYNEMNLKDLETKLAEKGHIQKDIFVLVQSITEQDPKSLRVIVDNLKNKHKKAIIVLVSVIDKKKIIAIATLTKNIISKVPSPKEIISIICGKGGGRDDMAQGGAKYSPQLEQKLTDVNDLIIKTIGN